MSSRYKLTKQEINSRVIRDFAVHVSRFYGLTPEWLDQVLESIKTTYSNHNEPEDPIFDLTENYILGGMVRDRLKRGGVYHADGTGQEFEDVEWYLGAVTRLLLAADGAWKQLENKGQAHLQEYWPDAEEIERQFTELVNGGMDKGAAREKILKKFHRKTGEKKYKGKQISRETFYRWIKEVRQDS